MTALRCTKKINFLLPLSRRLKQAADAVCPETSSSVGFDQVSFSQSTCQSSSNPNVSS